MSPRFRECCARAARTPDTTGPRALPDQAPVVAGLPGADRREALWKQHRVRLADGRQRTGRIADHSSGGHALSSGRRRRARVPPCRRRRRRRHGRRGRRGLGRRRRWCGLRCCRRRLGRRRPYRCGPGRGRRGQCRYGLCCCCCRWFGCWRLRGRGLGQGRRRRFRRGLRHCCRRRFGYGEPCCRWLRFRPGRGGRRLAGRRLRPVARGCRLPGTSRRCLLGPRGACRRGPCYARRRGPRGFMVGRH